MAMLTPFILLSRLGQYAQIFVDHMNNCVAYQVGANMSWKHVHQIVEANRRVQHRNRLFEIGVVLLCVRVRERSSREIEASDFA